MSWGVFCHTSCNVVFATDVRNCKPLNSVLTKLVALHDTISDVYWRPWYGVGVGRTWWRKSNIAAILFDCSSLLNAVRWAIGSHVVMKVIKHCSFHFFYWSVTDAMVWIFVTSLWHERRLTSSCCISSNIMIFKYKTSLKKLFWWSLYQIRQTSCPIYMSVESCNT